MLALPKLARSLASWKVLVYGMTLRMRQEGRGLSSLPFWVFFRRTAYDMRHFIAIWVPHPSFLRVRLWLSGEKVVRLGRRPLHPPGLCRVGVRFSYCPNATTAP